ncbi:NAD-dependent epimerase/dehydratase family protein [Hydrotalea sp.]|uniref:NAD-dependent epimerase/dehydratase family protein n=1 Tax=Hydrotalea sp. TaxID=2881279 RepID=UPI003D0A86CE
MNILITGGAGFIGSHLALSLIKRDHNVTVLDNLSTQVHGVNPLITSPLYKSIIDKVKFVKGSVTSRVDLLEALADNEVIVHLAAETGTGQSMYQIANYTNVNIMGTALILDILSNTSKHKVKKVIVASSRAIYGEGKYFSEELNQFVYPSHRSDADMRNGDFEVKYPGCSKPLLVVPTDEGSLLHPSSVYGITKLNQEQMVMTVCPLIGISPVAFRYQNVYGPGQSLGNPYTGILSIFSNLIKNHKPINIFEDGKESRDFVFIDDVVNATIFGIEKEEANGEVFNVGSGNRNDVLTVAKELIKNYGIDVPIIVSGNYRLGDIRHNYADMHKINTLLGFSPKVDFETGIRRFTEWVNSQDVKESRYEESISEMKRKGFLK